MYAEENINTTYQKITIKYHSSSSSLSVVAQHSVHFLLIFLKHCLCNNNININMCRSNSYLKDNRKKIDNKRNKNQNHIHFDK